MMHAIRRVGAKMFSKQYVGIAFVLPAVLFFAFFRIYPMIIAFWVSLHEWNLLTEPRFVGLENYANLFQEPSVWQSLRTSFVHAFGTSIPVWIIALSLALALNRPFRLRRWYMASYFLPHVFSIAVTSIVWKFLYQPHGLFNALLWRFFGITANWLSSASLAPFSIILMSIWMGFGYYVIIFLAGLQGIAEEYYEAAQLDGATWWQSFRYVTLPLLKPTMLFVIVVSLLSAFQSFDAQFMMTKGGPVNSTRVLTLLVYQNAFLYLRMGWASTIALLLFAILVSLTLLQLRFFRQD